MFTHLRGTGSALYIKIANILEGYYIEKIDKACKVSASLLTRYDIGRCGNIKEPMQEDIKPVESQKKIEKKEKRL